MYYHLKRKQVAIGYNPRLREYYIHLNKSRGVQLMDFCPWCGRKLPGSLRDMYCDEVREIGFEPFDDKDRLPKKYLTEEWWREKGV